MSITGKIVANITGQICVDITDAPQGGPVYGPELVVNGGFDSDLSGWEVINTDQNNTITQVAGALEIVSDGSLPAHIRQLNVFELGKTYNLWISAVANAGNTVGLKLQYSGSDTSIGPVNSTGSFEFEFTAGSTTLEIFRKGGGITDMIVDNVSVKEVL
ncbi:MAG: carbohydrate binding domain-containing protein [Thiolinea sp.]